jgi:hypothetical protein
VLLGICAFSLLDVKPALLINFQLTVVWAFDSGTLVSRAFNVVSARLVWDVIKLLLVDARWLFWHIHLGCLLLEPTIGEVHVI